MRLNIVSVSLFGKVDVWLCITVTSMWTLGSAVDVMVSESMGAHASEYQSHSRYRHMKCEGISSPLCQNISGAMYETSVIKKSSRRRSAEVGGAWVGFGEPDLGFLAEVGAPGGVVGEEAAAETDEGREGSGGASGHWRGGGRGAPAGCGRCRPGARGAVLRRRGGVEEREAERSVEEAERRCEEGEALRRQKAKEAVQERGGVEGAERRRGGEAVCREAAVLRDRGGGVEGSRRRGRVEGEEWRC
ncbi:hypothetical protein Syun_018671 [Stephania yunnanensis]|uniref:Uncharacterized protein n=1 Tax=Stephania yunnanensis TaxID=152371 RepID=A0AAP0IST9_9MAGN